MNVLCQRWNNRRAHFRPVEPIATGEYQVAEIPDDTTAKAFVEGHHYSGSFPAARYRFGLYWREILVGVAVFSQPPSEAVLAKMPCDSKAAVELGRFVLLDTVPGNGESWFLARCFELLREKGIEVLLSHSDPVPRRTLEGQLVLPGHVGIIYQATNAIYAGRTRAQQLCLLPNGTVFSERSMSKIRCAERGWERDVQSLLDLGAAPADHLVAGGEGPSKKAGRTADPRWTARRDWMWRAIETTCRRIPHAGNHRYLWALDKSKAMRRAVAAMACGQPYPKQRDAEPCELDAGDTMRDMPLAA